MTEQEERETYNDELRHENEHYQINYWNEIVEEDGWYKALIKANSDTIHTSHWFEIIPDVERYADGYIKGYADALVHFANNFGKK